MGGKVHKGKATYTPSVTTSNHHVVETQRQS